MGHFSFAVVETTTTITQTHETDSNQERTPVEANTSQFVDSQLLTTLSKNFQDSLFQSDDKKNDTIVEKDEEFQPCRVSNETYQHREKVGFPFSFIIKSSKVLDKVRSIDTKSIKNNDRKYY